MSKEYLPLEGGCTCKNIRYRLLIKPMYTHCCHCTWCQRESGSAFAINALVETDQLRLIQGKTETINIPSQSGKGQGVIRCPDCKIAVWSHYCGLGNSVAFLRVGTLDNSNACPPDLQIYTSTKQEWVTLSESIPSVEEYYQRSKYWPEESVARFKKAMGR